MQGDPLTHGLWEATAPPAPPTPPLQTRIAVDIVVVGAGFTGLSAALHLAEGGASVAVLEAAEIGFGASERNVGPVNAGLWVMPDQVPARLLATLGDAPSVMFELIEWHGMACETVRHGTRHCAPARACMAQVRSSASRIWARVRACDRGSRMTRRRPSACDGRPGRRAEERRPARRTSCL